MRYLALVFQVFLLLQVMGCDLLPKLEPVFGADTGTTGPSHGNPGGSSNTDTDCEEGADTALTDTGRDTALTGE